MDFMAGWCTSGSARRGTHRHREPWYAEDGIARAMLRVAVPGQREQEVSFFTVIVWRVQAEHAAQSLAKGSRVVVVGRLQQRSLTAEDGSAPARSWRSWPRSWAKPPLDGNHDQGNRQGGRVGPVREPGSPDRGEDSHPGPIHGGLH